MCPVSAAQRGNLLSPLAFTSDVTRTAAAWRRGARREPLGFPASAFSRSSSPCWFSPAPAVLFAVTAAVEPQAELLAETCVLRRSSVAATPRDGFVSRV